MFIFKNIGAFCQIRPSNTPLPPASSNPIINLTNHAHKVRNSYIVTEDPLLLKSLMQEKKSNQTSVKSNWLCKNNGPVQGYEHSLLVRRATDFLLQSVSQADSSSEVRHLVEVGASFFVHLRDERKKT